MPRRVTWLRVALTWFSAAMTVAMVFVVAWAVAARMPWWMCLGATLAVVKGVVTTYIVYHMRPDRGEVGVHPRVMRLGQLLTWAVLLICAPTLLRPFLRLIFTGDPRP